MNTSQSLLIQQSQLFDGAWYDAQYKDVSLLGMEALDHYMLIGTALDRDPHPLFSASYYRKQLTANSIDVNNALLHYISEGWRLHLNPHPLFDVKWYLQHNEDIAAAGIEPLGHFYVYAASEGRQPHETFFTRDVLAQAPSLLALGINPVRYYLEKLSEGKDLCPSATSYLARIKALPSAAASVRKQFTLSVAGNLPLALPKADPAIPSIVFDDIPDTPTPHKEHEPIDASVKIIAFYLPQFHPFPENDKWWGKGFTEWTNVGRGVPNFTGHYQPHCPMHLGYYDLRIPSVMEEQAALAKNYGIYGFNYYFYWFAGKTLMEAPLDAMLHNPRIDMPFCLTWANENWTRRWDGQESDILIAQQHSHEDSKALIRHLMKYFKDPRYIRVNGCPLFVVYRPDIIPDIANTASLWRQEMTAAGFPGIYLVSAQTFGSTTPEPFGFDAAVEFPPHTSVSSDITGDALGLRPAFKGRIYSYQEAVDNAVRKPEPSYKLFRTAMLSWDNTARKQDNSHIFHGFSLLRYKQWLSSLCVRSAVSQKYSPDEKLVFINAWNEWAEGTHLEPDQKFGYGYLQVTRDSVAQLQRRHLSFLHKKPAKQTANAAIVAHVHYSDVWPELSRRIKHAFPGGCDVFCSVTDVTFAEQIRRDFPTSYVVLVENRGRDILPFIELLRVILPLNYSYICKLHTKKTVYRQDGSDIREYLLESLLGSTDTVQRICSMFEMNNKLGMVCPENSLLPHSDHNMTFDHHIVAQISAQLGISFKYSVFPAGSMFWFRPAALANLTTLDQTAFPIESGLADGTPAHAIERLLCSATTSAGFEVRNC